MILDLQNQFSSAQAFSASGASTNYLDLGAQARQIQQGKELVLLVTVDVAADHTTGDETYQIDLQTDSDPAFGTQASVLSAVIPAAKLALGAKIILPLQDGLTLMKQYLRAFATLGGTTPSVTLTMEIQPQSMVDQYTTYKSGYSVL